MICKQQQRLVTVLNVYASTRSVAISIYYPCLYPSLQFKAHKPAVVFAKIGRKHTLLSNSVGIKQIVVYTLQTWSLVRQIRSKSNVRLERVKHIGKIEKNNSDKLTCLDRINFQNSYTTSSRSDIQRPTSFILCSYTVNTTINTDVCLLCATYAVRTFANCNQYVSVSIGQ